MAKKSEPSVKFKKFLGLNNKAEPRVISSGEVTRADNIDIDDRGYIRRRRGYDRELLASISISACWSSNDESRMFLIDGGTLEEYLGDGTTRELATGFTADEAYFVDAGDRYFLCCGPDLGFIDSDGYHNLVIRSPEDPVVLPVPGALSAGRRLVATVLEAPDGRQGGASRVMSVDLDADQGLQITVPPEEGFVTRLYVSNVNGDDLRYAGSLNGGSTLISNDWQLKGDILDSVQLYAGQPPSSGGPIAYHDGRLYIPVIDGPAGVSYLFMSEPFWPHLFTPWQDAETIQGQVRMIASTDGGVIVGTDRGIHLFNNDGLIDLAEYGVVPGPGAHYSRMAKKVYFWSREGVCSALPFENITEAKVSAAPGDRCYAGMIREGGFDRLIIGTHVDSDNQASNQR